MFYIHHDLSKDVKEKLILIKMDINYKTISSIESFGDIGSLGIKINIGGTALKDGIEECKKVQILLYHFQNSLTQEIIAYNISKDPLKTEHAKIERQGLLYCFYSNPVINACYVEEIPNGYCNQGCCRHLPWFIVTTQVGRIKIGWRKRVVEINWSDTTGTKTSEELFKDEDVTKGNKMIHAWDLNKAKKYIAKIILG